MRRWKKLPRQGNGQSTGSSHRWVFENEKGPGRGFLVETLESLSCIIGDDKLMFCSLAFYFKIKEGEKKKNQQQHREIRPENGEMRSWGAKVHPRPQETEQRGVQKPPQGLRGGAGAQTPG